MCFASSKSERSICRICTVSRLAFKTLPQHRKADIKRHHVYRCAAQLDHPTPELLHHSSLRRPSAAPRGSGVECERVSWSLCSGQSIMFSSAWESTWITCQVSEMILPKESRLPLLSGLDVRFPIRPVLEGFGSSIMQSPMCRPCWPVPWWPASLAPLMQTSCEHDPR